MSLKNPLGCSKIAEFFFGAYIIINEWDKCVAEIFLVIFDICNHPIEISMSWNFVGAYIIINEGDKCVAENFWVLFNTFLIYEKSRRRRQKGIR